MIDVGSRLHQGIIGAMGFGVWILVLEPVRALKLIGNRDLFALDHEDVFLQR